MTPSHMARNFITNNYNVQKVLVYKTIEYRKKYKLWDSRQGK